MQLLLFLRDIPSDLGVFSFAEGKLSQARLNTGSISCGTNEECHCSDNEECYCHNNSYIGTDFLIASS